MASDAQAATSPAENKRSCFKTAELVFGILMGVWSNLTTLGRTDGVTEETQRIVRCSEFVGSFCSFIVSYNYVFHLTEVSLR